MTVFVPRQPQSQPIGLPTADRSAPDPLATPRAVLPRAVVAAAVASLPTLSPVLLPHEPEYCLATKRKPADTGDGDPDAPRSIKRSKSDQQEGLFGPLATPPQADAPQQSPFDIAIEQAIAAALYVFPTDAHSEPVPMAVDGPSLVDQLDIQYPSHSNPPLVLSAFGDALPQDAASQTWQQTPVPSFFSDDVSSPPVAGPSTPVVPPPVVAVEGIDIIPEQPQPVLAAEAEPQTHNQATQPEKRRRRQDSLWMVACKERVGRVIGLCGKWDTLRKILGQPKKELEQAEQQPQSCSDSPRDIANANRSDSSSACKDLPMEIYTPSTFSSDDDDEDEAEREMSESELEEEADMSFELDWDSDSDADEDEEGSDCDPSVIQPDEHETIMDVTCEQAEKPSLPLSSPPPETPLPPALIGTIQISSTPELPRLSSFRAQNIREWLLPDLKRGTPGHVHPSHCGVLTREHLCAAAQRDREAWRAMWQ